MSLVKNLIEKSKLDDSIIVGSEIRAALAEPVGPDRKIDLNGNIYTIAEALAMWQKDLNESEARAKRIETLEALLRDIRVCLSDGLIKDRINHALG
jgi:hypothetical protein